MSNPILTANETRRYVIDADGNLIAIQHHTKLKLGQRLATQADVDAKSAPPAEPVAAPAPVVNVYLGDDFAVKTPRDRTKAAKATEAKAD
jgi:hypothetical protein